MRICNENDDPGSDDVARLKYLAEALVKEQTYTPEWWDIFFNLYVTALKLALDPTEAKDKAFELCHDLRSGDYYPNMLPSPEWFYTMKIGQSALLSELDAS